MKIFYLKIFTILIFAFNQHTTHSQSTYFISTTGSNSNSGTESNPFLTINKAISSLGSQGGTCIIKGGTYHEEIKLSKKDNITIKAYNNEYVILDGTKEITSTWTQSSGNPNIYETTLTENIWQLFIDDEQQVPARWPNAQFNDDSVFDQHNWSPADDSVSKGTIIDLGNLESKGFDAQGAIAVANFGSYKTSVLNILTHTGSTMTYNLNELNGHAGKHYYYFLEKKLEFLDVPNEWFFEPITKKLSVYGNPTGKKIQGKVQSYAVTMDDCSNITIEKLNFFSTTISAIASNNITVNNCLFSFPSSSRRMLGEIEAPKVTKLETNNNSKISNFKFYKCLFEHTDGEALVLKGANNTVEDCYFHHIDYSCGATGGLGVTIKNNGANINFKQNTIHTTGASATLDLGPEQKVSYNDISKTGYLQSDGSITQITKANVNNSEVHHNWLHDSAKSGMRYDAPFKSPWDAGTGGLVHHNVMWNLSKALQIKGNYQEVYNNTCFNNADVQNDISILDEDFTASKYSENWADQTTYTSSNTHTETINNASDKISGDRKKSKPTPGTKSNNYYSTTTTDIDIKSLLEDPDNYDFRPKPGSILIDYGTPIAGITDGFTGNAPDAGAYERTDNWTAGTNWNPDFYPWSFLTLAVEHNILDKKQLQVFPIPAKNVLNIKSSNRIEKLVIYNLMGQQVLIQHNNTKKINIAHLTHGVYILKITNENGFNISKKFIIQQ